MLSATCNCLNDFRLSSVPVPTIVSYITYTSVSSSSRRAVPGLHITVSKNGSQHRPKQKNVMRAPKKGP